MRPKSHRTVEDSLDLIDIIIAIIAFRAGVVNVKLDAFQVSTDEDIWLLAPEVDDRQEGAMTDDQTGAVCNSIDLVHAPHVVARTEGPPPAPQAACCQGLLHQLSPVQHDHHTLLV